MSGWALPENWRKGMRPGGKSGNGQAHAGSQAARPTGGSNGNHRLPIYGKSRSGRYLGSLTNPDTGCPVETDGTRLTTVDFDQKRLHEIVEQQKGGTTKHCAMWQADGSKIVRMAPAEYMGRYMPEWFDYAIADEIHQLAGDTAQGNALGVLNRTARWFLGLTGTLLSGYADDLFNTLFRTDARRMTEDGYEWGSTGRERFTRDFGVIETIERITVEDNACSKKTQKTVAIKRKPGASPLLFGKYLMDHCAFIGLEDISDGLPSYREEVVPVAMEEPLKTAYEELEEDITACLKEHRGNSSVVSTLKTNDSPRSASRKEIISSQLSLKSAIFATTLRSDSRRVRSVLLSILRTLRIKSSSSDL
jgi:hypothetical protein